MTDDMRLLPALPLLALLASAGPLAQGLAGLDLRVHESDIEPAVTLRERENRTVEEYRVNGNLYMVKITPSVGAPYYLSGGRGRLRGHELEPGLGPVRAKRPPVGPALLVTPAPPRTNDPRRSFR